MEERQKSQRLSDPLLLLFKDEQSENDQYQEEQKEICNQKTEERQADLCSDPTVQEVQRENLLWHLQ